MSINSKAFNKAMCVTKETITNAEPAQVKPSRGRMHLA